MSGRRTSSLARYATARERPGRAVATRSEGMKAAMTIPRLLVVLASIGGAVAGADERKFSGNVGAGGVFPTSSSGDRFKTGFNFNLGCSYIASSKVAVQVEYGYNSLGVKGRVLNATDFDANHLMYYFDLNLVLKTPSDRNVGFYGLIGGGYYYRKVEITRFAGNALVPVCDPWLYVCYTTVVPVENILGSRSSWDPGFDVGAGISFKAGESARIYVESRYHYIFGDEFRLPTGGTQKATGQYLPLTVGVRF